MNQSVNHVLDYSQSKAEVAAERQCDQLRQADDWDQILAARREQQRQHILRSQSCRR